MVHSGLEFGPLGVRVWSTRFETWLTCLSWKPCLLHNKFPINSHPIPVLFPPFSYFCPQRTLGRLVKTIENLPPNKRLHTFRSYVWLVMTIEIIPPNKRLHTFRSYVWLVMTIEIIPSNKRLHTF